MPDEEMWLGLDRGIGAVPIDLGYIVQAIAKLHYLFNDVEQSPEWHYHPHQRLRLNERFIDVQFIGPLVRRTPP